MPNIIFYATTLDIEVVRDWINAEPDVSWIVKSRQEGNTCYWTLFDQLAAVAERRYYTLWNKQVGPVRTPVAPLQGEYKIVRDPYNGWSQELERKAQSVPWFGEDHRHLVILWFAETSRLGPGYIGRSGFSWSGNRFRVLGDSAHPEVSRWWNRLKRFIKRNSIQVPWPEDVPGTRHIAYVFADAWEKRKQGKRLSTNPG